MVKPSQRKAMAQHAVANHQVTIRLVCAAFFISETCYRYQPVNDDENTHIADLLVDLTEKETDWGFGQCFHYLPMSKVLVGITSVYIEFTAIWR